MEDSVSLPELHMSREAYQNFLTAGITRMASRILRNLFSWVFQIRCSNLTMRPVQPVVYFDQASFTGQGPC